ncbi:MAG: eL32 family ribosomal protein [Candidatus Aenigmatarchaeota archaeon]|nr:eL32 family ribosomal protein [Candidatus Aenigmarchaeota archaeon]
MKKKIFRRQLFSIKRLGEKWRKPKGRQSKLRLEKKSKGKRVKIGFGSPKSERKILIRIFNEKDIEKLRNINLDENRYIILLASSVGKKKRKDLIKKLKEMLAQKGYEIKKGKLNKMDVNKKEVIKENIVKDVKTEAKEK